MPHYDGPSAPSIAELRARSLKTVETVFAILVLACAAVAAIIHSAGAAWGVPAEAQEPVASAFLALAASDLVLLLACRSWFTRGIGN